MTRQPMMTFARDHAGGSDGPSAQPSAAGTASVSGTLARTDPSTAAAPPTELTTTAAPRAAGPAEPATPLRPPAPPLPPDVSPETVVRQVVHRMRMAGGQTRSELVVRLEPPQMGQVRMRLVQAGERIVAEFRTSQAAVREVLERRVPELRQALEQQGLRPELVTIRIETDQAASGRSAHAASDRPDGQAPQRQGASSANDGQQGKQGYWEADDEGEREPRDGSWRRRRHWWA